MATSKPEVLVLHLVDEIETKFQRLSHVFVVQQLDESSLNAGSLKFKMAT
jgi:hypothetical protein